MSNAVDEVIEILLRWYQDGKIQVIDAAAAIDAYRARGGNSWDSDHIVAQVLDELSKDADKEVLLKEGTVI